MVTIGITWWCEAVADELPPSEREPLFNLSEKESSLSVQAALLVWQFEGPHGLSRFYAVRKDRVLMQFCEQLLTLCRRELAGEDIVPQEYQQLHEKIQKEWLVIGERERVRRMRIARQWAWLGGRKWAWIPTRPWSKTWMWLIAATRPRSRSQPINIIRAWNSAWKWSRFWQSDLTRIRSLGMEMSAILKAHED